MKQFRNEKQIKSKLKSINPSTKFLFGGKVFDLFKDLNATAQVNNFGSNFLLRSNKRKGKWSQGQGGNYWNQDGASYPKRGRGGFQARGRSSYKRGGRGGSSRGNGSTLEKFLE